jgi:hypothetical protein
MRAERKVEPSAWMAHDSLGQPTFETHGMSGGQPLYTLDASRLVWAERIEAAVGCLHCSWMNSDVVHKYCDVCYGKLRAADWLRSQDGAR